MQSFFAEYKISSIIPELLASLEHSNIVIVESPPGTGKSTILPLSLLNAAWLAGNKILMLEPRRIAARSVAVRMSALLGETVGQTVGYRVRFEKKISARTRIEVLTEALLSQAIREDPTLDGVGLVIFDEFHERNLQSDLGLALLRNVQAALRPDLKIIIMSATLDARNLSEALVGAPILSVKTAAFPLEIIYAKQESKLHISAQVAQAVLRAMQEQKGDVLAFLPGTAEIRRCQEILLAEFQDKKNIDVKNSVVLPLYGDLNLEQQAQALLPDPEGKRKIVLSTSLAETSLTVEGVQVVVDSGFSRLPKFDARTGLTKLITQRITQDTATQRAGRAARLGPGVAYRLWTTSAQASLIATRRPEIVEADLAPLALQLVAWGNDAELQWITAPPVGTLLSAKELLVQLGAMEAGRITTLGKNMLRFAAHPRLARMMLHEGGATLAADIAAVLEERDAMPDAGADVVLRLEALRSNRVGKNVYGADKFVLARTEKLAAQHRALLNTSPDNTMPNHQEVGALLALAYPDRVAQLRAGESRRYKLSNGRGVQLGDGDGLTSKPYLVVAHLDAGTSEGKIFLAAELQEETLLKAAKPTNLAEWNEQQGAFVARQELRFGELVLKTKVLQEIDEAVKSAAILQAVRASKLQLLAWSDVAKNLQARVLSLRIWREATGEGWPDFSDDGLINNLEEWLGPHVGSVRRKEDLQAINLEQVLQTLLPYPLQRQLELLAPKTISVPSGSNIRLMYFSDGSAPVLAVRLQEMFGQLVTPTINDGRTPVLLHLLSPAFRPVQVTQDLNSFWRGAYFEVRKDLRIRYPKHSWPEEPLLAQAVRGAKRKA